MHDAMIVHAKREAIGDFEVSEVDEAGALGAVDVRRHCRGSNGATGSRCAACVARCVMTTQNRDVHRSAVYRAEDQWSATLDRGGVVDFFGSVIDVPEQLRFGALEAVRTYVDDVVAHLKVPPVHVRHRRGGNACALQPG